MKLLKRSLFFILFTTFFACNEDVKLDLETDTIPEYIKVSKIVNSDWAAASNWVATLDNVIVIFRKKHL